MTNYKIILYVGGECGVPTYTRNFFASAYYGKPWYSFNYGPFHFLFISTEQDFAVGSD